MSDAPVATPVAPALEQCPCCHFNLKNDPLAFSLEDQIEFMRCMLATPSRLFHKEYKLFGGKLSLHFKAITSVDSARLAGLLEQQQAVQDPMAYSIGVAKIKLCFYLTQINNTKYTMYPADVPQTVEAVFKQFTDTLGKESEELLSAAIECLFRFLRLTTELTRSGFDENFAKGAGIA